MYCTERLIRMEKKLLKCAFSLPRRQLKVLSKLNVYWKCYIYRTLEEKLELMVSGLIKKGCIASNIAVLM